MYEELTPPARVTRHGIFGRYFYIVTSFLLSSIFVTVLLTGAVFYHLYHKIVDKTYVPSEESTRLYKPREAFPNIKKMKATKDLRYYALHLDLDLEDYKITTEDGYILTLHHLINPKESVAERDKRKPILLQHGLLSCSGAYLTAGYNSLAFYLVESGYDVWMGNNRSWFEVVHSEIEGNLMHSEEYWDWDMRNLAYYDLPCIIENVLSHKPQHDKLVLVGHSQGSTQTFLMLKNDNLKHVHSKIEYLFPLAPAIFPGSMFHERAFIKFMHRRNPFSFKLIYGCCSFLRNLSQARHYLSGTRFYGSLSYMTFRYLFGWEGKKWGKNKKVWHFHFVFNVSYVSTKLMNWWLSQWVPEGFSNQLLPRRAYQTQSNCEIKESNSSKAIKDDSKSYFPFTSPWFVNKSTVVPMVIFTGSIDYLVDGKRLITHMREFEKESYEEGRNLDIVELDDYSHLDVVWAEDLIGRIGYVITEKLESLETATVEGPNEKNEIELDV